LPRNAIYTSTKSPAWEIKKDYTCKRIHASNGVLSIEKELEGGIFPVNAVIHLLKTVMGAFMRKSISALIFGLSLLTTTSVFMGPPPIDKATVVPFSSMLFSVQATPSAIPTSSFTPQAAETPVRGNPPLSLTLILLALCCGFLLLIGMFILGFIVRKDNIKEWEKGQQSDPH
jgi:sensor domain CHASE-containing protein